MSQAVGCSRLCEALYDQINKGEAMAVAPPEPAGTDAVAFVAALHRLKVWSGLGYRHLERRAAQAGHNPPYSTAPLSSAGTNCPADQVRALLLAYDDPQHLERPADFDLDTSRECFARLVSALEKRFGPSHSALAQDASFYGVIDVPANATGLGRPSTTGTSRTCEASTAPSAIRSSASTFLDVFRRAFGHLTAFHGWWTRGPVRGSRSR